MRPPLPEKPKGLDTPGLRWRPRASHWVGYWQGRQDISKRGYPIKTRQVWPPSVADQSVPPDPDEWVTISSHCITLQDEMLAWGKGEFADNPAAGFDDTFSALIDIYQRDK